MRSLMTFRVGAKSKSIQVSRAHVRSERARARRFANVKVRSASKFFQKPHRTALKAKAKVCSPHSHSYIETSAVRVFARMQAIVVLTMAGTGTITLGLLMDREDWENSCRNCENIVNIPLHEIDSGLSSSRKVLHNKGLVPFANWPLGCTAKITCPSSLVQVSLVPRFRI
jgi:hypothetical protein